MRTTSRTCSGFIDEIKKKVRGLTTSRVNPNRYPQPECIVTGDIASAADLK